MEILIKRKEFDFLLEEIKTSKKQENNKILAEALETKEDFKVDFIDYLNERKNPKEIFQVISFIISFKENFYVMLFIAELIIKILHENNQSENSKDYIFSEQLIDLFNEMLFKAILWLFSFDKNKTNQKSQNSQKSQKRLIDIFLKIPKFSNEEIQIMENLYFFELLGIYYKQKNEYKIAYDYLMKIPNYENTELLNELEDLLKENTLLAFDDTELDLPLGFKKSLKPLLNEEYFKEVRSRRNSDNSIIVKNK